MIPQTAERMAADSSRTSLLVGLGVLAKLVVDVVVIAGFGLTSATDAFFVAYTLLIIVEALVYSACQSGLVPVFVGAQTVGGPQRVWALFNSLFTLALVAGVALTIGGVLGSAALTAALAPGLDAATGALAADLARTLLLGWLFVAPIGIMRAFLNAHNLFGAPAALEIIRGLTVIVVVLGGALLTGERRIEALAAGFAAAALIQTLVLGFVIVRRLGFGYRPLCRLDLLRSSGVGRMLFVPLLDHSVGQGVLIAERIIGSFLPAGSISAISYGHRLATVIGATLFTGIEVVSLSALAASLKAGTAARLQEARATLRVGVRLVLVLGIPVAASVWAVKLPLTQLLFERGMASVGAEAALVLGLYSLSIPLYGYGLVARSYLFADGRPGWSLLATCTQLIGGVAAAVLLAQAWGAVGVAIAFGIGHGLAGVVCAVALGGVAGPEQGRVMLRLTVRMLVAALAMAGVMVVLTNQLLAYVPFAGMALAPARMLVLALVGVAGGVTLLGLLYTLQVEEVSILKTFTARLFTNGRVGRRQI